jgi:hypothetical protein
MVLTHTLLLFCYLILYRKTYQELYPGNATYCFTDAYSVERKYCRKHNPYMSYININRNVTRCGLRIVNAVQLDIDLDSGNFPQYSFYTPDLDNDAHEYAFLLSS